MDKLQSKAVIIIIVFLLIGVFFVIDPFNYWPTPLPGPCESTSKLPRCTGKIIFFWQTP